MEKFVSTQKVKRKRKHGFLSKMQSAGGKKTIKRRRDKSRSRIAL